MIGRALLTGLAFICAGAFPAGAQAVAAKAPALVAPDEQWQAYKERFISPEGRLFDDSAQGVSHSEGQGYAMLLAVFAGDSATFARLWEWSVANLFVRGDGLAAWRWRPQDAPHVLDRNNATDGDLLIAWALAEAGKKWKNAGYLAQARRIALSLDKVAVYGAAFGKAISPGVSGYGPKDSEDGPVVNLSYWVFPAFDALAEVAPEVDWASLKASGLALIDQARFGPRSLPTDWIALKSGPHPAAAFPKTFGYDVLRVPLYLAWSAPREKQRLSRILAGWTADGGQPLSVIDVVSGSPGEALDGAGYQAVAAVLRCAAEGARFPDNLRAASLERYYPATLQMLALAMLRLRLPQCL